MNGYSDEFKEYLIKVKKTSSNTLDAYVRDVLQFLSYLDFKHIISVNQIEKGVILEYIDNLKKAGKSDATKTRVIASVKCYFKYLSQKGYINSNPAQEIKNPRNKKKLPEILDSKEVMLLISEPKGDDYKSIRDRAMLELMYATGIRVSELIELTLSDVNTQIGIINLHNNKSSRIVPVYPKAAKDLSEYITDVRPALVLDGKEEKLFTNMNGQPLSRQGCWKIIKYYADRAGIKGDITPQTLRHSFATHLLENGAQLKDVKEMLGHSDISSTQVYANIIKSRFVQSYEKFHPLANK